jgi:hypothetical protein
MRERELRIKIQCTAEKRRGGEGLPVASAEME